MNELESEPQNQVLETLQKLQLKGVVIEHDASEIRLRVVSKEDWDKELPKLEGLFWPLIKESYVPGIENEQIRRRQMELPFKKTDLVHIRTDGVHILGYLSFEHLKEDPTVGVIRDVVVSKSERGRALAESMYDSVLASEAQSGIHAIIGTSINVAALKSRIRAGARSGFEAKYAPPLSNDLQLEKLRALNLAYAKEQEMLGGGKLPPGHEGFLLLKPDILPSLREDDVASLEGSDPLLPALKEILALQKDHPNETVVAHFFSIRKS